VNCHACDHPYDPPEGLLHRCPRCGHGFRPFEGDPIAFHATEYRKSFRRDTREIDEHGRPTPLFHRMRKGIVRKRVRLVKPYLRATDHCLDIGAGAGTFCTEIRKRVASIECTELDENLAAESRRLGFPTRTGDFLAMDFDAPFDVVFAWHVLEHVEDARAFVERAMRLARRHVIIEVPWKRRVPEAFDGHYHYFNETSLRLVLREPRVIDMREGVQAPALFAVARGGAP
jgi:rubredoxin